MSIDKNKIGKFAGASLKNPLAGKKVIFVEDENDIENADGVRGHLEAVGESIYNPKFYDKYVKRILDIILSGIGLILLLPVYMGIAIAIQIEDPGPVLFTQTRVGKNKEYFQLHKFRSMKTSAPHDVPTHMLDNPDQYITKVGKFLRAHSLDELPQIWDIFVGNMSIIGPRPGLWNQDVLTAERDKYGANDVRPGLTGWAQINGRDELEIPIKAKSDGEYVQKIGLRMDMKCFIGSIGVFVHDDSVVEGSTKEKKKIGRHYTAKKTSAELTGQIGFSSPVFVDTTTVKRILITGVGSYIGESFRTYALEHYKDNFQIDAVDMLDSNWREADFARYDIVYHVAGIAHSDVGNVDDATKETYYSINTDLAVEVCRIAKESGVKKFIFMSSAIVYGEPVGYGEEKVITIKTVPSPANFYGDSKLQADVAVREFADKNFTVIVLRPPMIYGKDSKGNYRILSELAKMSPVFPNVNNKRSMLYIDNLCKFLCQIMLVNSPDQAVVLIPQNREWVKTADMVEEISKAANKKLRKSGLLNPVVLIGSKIPGKIGRLTNKAFGNMVFDKNISTYEGIDYQIVSLKESIARIEMDFKAMDGKSFENNNVATSNELEKKKILLIALPGYSDGIVTQMRNMGAEVDYLNDKPNDGVICKTLGRLKINLYQTVIHNYYKKELAILKNKQYDYILVIRGEYTPADTLKLLKEYYPEAKVVLYMWDSLENNKGIEKKWYLYDKVFTFDRIDYLNNQEKLEFLPLYYYEEYLPKIDLEGEPEYAVSFIGTGHQDRIKIVKSVAKQCSKMGKNTFVYFFLPHKFVYLQNKLKNPYFKDVTMNDVHFKMLPFAKVYDIYGKSKCVIDIESPTQHGLTMRSIEMIGLKRKLITTNKDIVNYDFYNPNNIMVVDRNNFKVDLQFFDKPYEKIDDSIYEKYSLRNWILEVLR